MGSVATRAVNCNLNDDGTCDYIWPICLPKNDEEFTSQNAMIAGWLDTPPISLTVQQIIAGNSFGSFAFSGERFIRL